jgi:ketosteroid isomerase-like protein
MNRLQLSSFAVLLCTLALSACQTMPQPDPGDTRKLLDTDIAFSAKSAESGAPEAFYTYMSETGVQLPPAGDPIQGRAAIRANMTGSNYKLVWQPQIAEVSLSGDLGWTWGEWQRLDSGGHQSARGRYVNIWKKQADGSWRVRLDMGNSAPRE